MIDSVSFTGYPRNLAQAQQDINEAWRTEGPEREERRVRERVYTREEERQRGSAIRNVMEYLHVEGFVSCCCRRFCLLLFVRIPFFFYYFVYFPTFFNDRYNIPHNAKIFVPISLCLSVCEGRGKEQTMLQMLRIFCAGVHTLCRESCQK